MTLEELKNKIFQKVYDSEFSYDNACKKYGYLHDFTRSAYSERCALRGLVRDLGLSAEYADFWERMAEKEEE